MNVYDSHQTAEQLHDWLARHMPDRPHPPVKRPINWLRWISGLTFVSGIATAGFVAWPFLLPIIQNRNIWAAVSLIAILLFTSGHMFNHIRKVPYIAQDGRGGISYFAPGFQNQLGMETQIVAAMCKKPRNANPVGYIVYMLTFHRRYLGVCYHLPRDQSPPHGRPQGAEPGRLGMGPCSLHHVQHSSQRIPRQERWLPVQLATLHVSHLLSRGRAEKVAENPPRKVWPSWYVPENPKSGYGGQCLRRHLEVDSFVQIDTIHQKKGKVSWAFNWNYVRSTQILESEEKQYAYLRAHVRSRS